MSYCGNRENKNLATMPSTLPRAVKMQTRHCTSDKNSTVSVSKCIRRFVCRYILRLKLYILGRIVTLVFLCALYKYLATTTTTAAAAIAATITPFHFNRTGKVYINLQTHSWT